MTLGKFAWLTLLWLASYARFSLRRRGTIDARGALKCGQGGAKSDTALKSGTALLAPSRQVAVSDLLADCPAWVVLAPASGDELSCRGRARDFAVVRGAGADTLSSRRAGRPLGVSLSDEAAAASTPADRCTSHD